MAQAFVDRSMIAVRGQFVQPVVEIVWKPRAITIASRSVEVGAASD